MLFHLLVIWLFDFLLLVEKGTIIR